MWWNTWPLSFQIKEKVCQGSGRPSLNVQIIGELERKRKAKHNKTEICEEVNTPFSRT